MSPMTHVWWCVSTTRIRRFHVQIQGVARTSEDQREQLDIATRIAARHMGPDRAEEFGKRNAVPGGIVVRFRPTRVVSAFNLQDRDR
jgi:hypothetical protein